MDEYLEDEFCVIELESDLPECSAGPGTDDNVDDDLADLFGGGEGGFDIGGIEGYDDENDLYNEIYDELVDSPSDGEGDETKPDTTEGAAKGDATPPTVTEKPPLSGPLVTGFKAEPGMNVSPRNAINRPVFSTPQAAIQGQIIYNPTHSNGHQVLHVQNTGNNSPHISPQIVRQVSLGPSTADNGGQMNFPGNFVQMPRRQMPPGQGQHINPIAMVHHSQIKNMHNWNDSRKTEKSGTAAPTGATSETPNPATTQSSAAKNMDKWRNDEALGDKATISPVLYANIKHPNLKADHPDWSQRQKQIQRLWRRISQEGRAPFLTLARENRHKQKAQNAKNQRGRLNSGNVEQKNKKNETQVHQVGQVSMGNPTIGAPFAPHMMIQTNTQPIISPISGQQIITGQSQPQIVTSTTSPQVMAATAGMVTTTTKQPTPQQQPSESPKSEHWKQYVVPSPSEVPSSPKPPQSPAPPSPAQYMSAQSPVTNNSNGGKILQSPSQSPSPGTPSTPLLSQDPFINQNTEHHQQQQQRPASRNRHGSHEYSHHSPMLSPHSPMPPPMSPSISSGTVY